jgi:nitrogen fixation protein NifZ
VRPRFDYGDEVRVMRNVRNDGTFPGEPTGALLVPRGSVGYVRDVGTFLQDQIIYSIHFLEGHRLVGCREEELQAAADPWVSSRFDFRDKVRARMRLGSQGRVLVDRGELGEVLKVIRAAPGAVSYHVLFPGRTTLQVAEDALEPAVTEEKGAA